MGGNSFLIYGQFHCNFKIPWNLHSIWKLMKYPVKARQAKNKKFNPFMRCHECFLPREVYLERSSIYDWLELFRKLGHETLPCRRRELYYSAMFHLTREKLSVKGLTLPVLSLGYRFFDPDHQLLRYSSNKIRKAQNEHLNIICQNLNCL